LLDPIEPLVRLSSRAKSSSFDLDVFFAPVSGAANGVVTGRARRRALKAHGVCCHGFRDLAGQPAIFRGRHTLSPESGPEYFDVIAVSLHWWLNHLFQSEVTFGKDNYHIATCNRPNIANLVIANNPYELSRDIFGAYKFLKRWIFPGLFKAVENTELADYILKMIAFE
jgi:hypothetical protein